MADRTGRRPGLLPGTPAHRSALPARTYHTPWRRAWPASTRTWWRSARQAPARLEAIKRRHNLRFLVASDPRHSLIVALNIGFASPPASVVLGTGHSVLPFASVVVADRAGRVRYTDVHADWTTLTAPGPIIRAVRAIKT